MAQELNLTTDETAALDRIDKALKGSPGAKVDAKALEAGDLCEKYRDLRPSLVILVKIVKKIPVIGAKVAAALEFLMGVADMACPV